MVPIVIFGQHDLERAANACDGFGRRPSKIVRMAPPDVELAEQEGHDGSTDSCRPKPKERGGDGDIRYGSEETIEQHFRIA